MPKLIVTRGLPGSGKSTWAMQQSGAVRVNRDDLRKMLFNAEGVLPWDQEELVTQSQRAIASAALNQLRDVIVDDTNLRQRYVREWERFAREHVHCDGFAVHDFFDVSLDECKRRDAGRARSVGSDVIDRLHDKFLAQHGGALPPYEYAMEEEPSALQYQGTPSRPAAVIVDLDGTLARMKGRSPFDWSRVGEDALSVNVARTVDALHLAGYEIVYLSGRDSKCYHTTESWLTRHGLPQGELFMRAEGDNRKDHIIKSELFWSHIAPNYDVKFCLDDRDSVVAMWRSMGLQCFQVAPGAF